jgi:hypothetical protein
MGIHGEVCSICSFEIEEMHYAIRDMIPKESFCEWL